jgi:hypothetical protein
VKLFVAQRRRETAAVIGVDDSNIRMWQKHKAMISECEASQRNSLDPRKGDFLTVSSRFPQETQDWSKLYCTVLIACTAALSFFQNPVLDRESNQHPFFSPLNL